MKLTYINELTTEEYMTLRSAVGWSELCAEQVGEGLRHSAFLCSCHADGEIAGAARVIWDGGYIAYLADVMVKPQYQAQGIGSELVERSIDFVRSRLKPGWKIKIVLISTKGREDFYEKLGFSPRPNEHAGAGMDMWV